MWARIASQVIISLATKLATFLYSSVSKWLARKKLRKELDQKAKRVEDAKTHDEVLAAADDLP